MFQTIRMLLVAGLALTAGFAAAQTPMTPEQTQAIERIIRDYLLKNPELILEAVEGLEQKRRGEAERSAKDAIVQFREEILNDPGSVVSGNPQGDVTVVEFFDYRCPYCKQVVPSLTQLLKDDGKIRFVYKELPILGPDSVVASRAAIAARAQNKYIEMHNALMRARGTLDEPSVLKIATETGLDARKLKTDMGAPEVDMIIERNRTLARALNLNGTPAFVIGDTTVPGAIDLPTLKSLVAEARKKKS